MGIVSMVAIRRVMCIRSNTFRVFDAWFRTLRSWQDGHDPTLARHTLRHHPRQHAPYPAFTVKPWPVMLPPPHLCARKNIAPVPSKSLLRAESPARHSCWPSLLSKKYSVAPQAPPVLLMPDGLRTILAWLPIRTKCWVWNTVRAKLKSGLRTDVWPRSIIRT